MKLAASTVESTQRFHWSGTRTAAVLAIFNFGICYFRSFVFPNIPLLPWGDAAGFLNNGARIAAGRLPYRDYFAFVPPGTELTYALLIREFGARSWIPNIVVAGLAAAAAALMTLAAARFLRGPIIALPALLLAAFVLPGSLDATHHWFSTVAVMGAMLVLLYRETLPAITVVGILGGIAALYTPNKGATAVAGFIAYLVWKRWRAGTPARDCWRACLLLLGLSSAVFLAGNAYFIRAAGFARWLYCVVVFPLRYYPTVHLNNWHVYGDQFRSLPTAMPWIVFITFPFLSVHAAVPLVYVICLVVLWRRSKNGPIEAWDKVLLVCLTGLAMFLAVAFSPSWKRLSIASLPAMILLAWLLQRPGRALATFRIGLAVIALALPLVVTAWIQSTWSGTLDLPVGKTAFREPDRYEEYRYAMGRTCCGQFMFGIPPMLFALGVKNPAPIDVFTPFDYTRPEQVTAMIHAMEQYKVPLLMLNRGMLSWPGATSSSDHLGPLRTYLACHYRVTKTFPTEDQLWERIEHSGQCDE
jgi:hypothetical protein